MKRECLLPKYRVFNYKIHEFVSDNTGSYRTEQMEVTISSQKMSDEYTEFLCQWKNITDKTIRCQLLLEIRADFKFTHYLIPGVSVNGNNWGNGKEPKNLLCNGVPWVFDYKRTTIPSCTISENKEKYLAVFVSDQDRYSLESSCSMLPSEDGTMLHRVWYPCIEEPKTYCTRDGYCDEKENFLTLNPGEIYSTKLYILEGRPVKENYAAANVQNIALQVLDKRFFPKYSMDETAELACQFAKRLLQRKNGHSLFSIGQSPAASGKFVNQEGNEFGWCGQNGMYAKLFLKRGFERNDDNLINIAISNLDLWIHEAVGKTGLIHTHYDWLENEVSNVEDTCNQGFAIYEFVEAWKIAKAYGLEKKDWILAAKRVADFFVGNYSDEYGFGKAWDTETGKCIDWQGTIGAYIIPGLVLLWDATKEEKYLRSAKKAYRFYKKRDMDQFQCTAGALDTYCIDKESSGPLLAGALALYEAEHKKEWLECAKMAGWYFCSWMFHFDILEPPESDFAQYGYRTVGGTCVSAQHHHIDVWGALIVPQLVQLWKLTGDWKWRKRAELIWGNAVQNIAPQEGKVIHGLFRDAGAQNEGYLQCCWGEEAPGHMNDWLVAWPMAFCWNTAVQIMKEDLIEEQEGTQI